MERTTAKDEATPFTTMKQSRRNFKTCESLGLARTTAATAVYYYRKYVATFGMKENKYIISVICIRLATKAEFFDEHGLPDGSINSIILKVYGNDKIGNGPNMMPEVGKHQHIM